MRLALSTSWNSKKYDDAGPMIDEIRQLGFDSVELGFSLTAEMVDGVKGIVKEGGIRVASLHNYCPIPDELDIDEATPDCYSLSSKDENERGLAVKYTKRTIDTAESLGAGAVVLHSGKVEIVDSTKALAQMYQSGLKDTKEYKSLVFKMEEEREFKGISYVKKAAESLSEISLYASKKNIRLAVENRIYFREIPSSDEIGFLLNSVYPNVYYWHDTGHAQVLENLGFARHISYLEKYNFRMIGMHIHDILKAKDHMAPLKGEFDFSLLKPYIKKDTILVLEAHQPATGEEIKAGAAYLEKLFS